MSAAKYISPLKKFHAITSSEFLLAIEATEHFHNNMKIEDNSAKAVGNGAVLIGKLQYQDIFGQRLLHLMQAHDEVMKLCIDDRFKESFLHLQYFQFSIIVYDVRECISTIEAVIKNESQTHIDVFSRRSEIEGLAEEIKNCLRETRSSSKLMDPPLTKRQIQICNQFYTMESERIILDWFLNNMPLGTCTELQVFYHSKQRNADRPEIELF